MTGRKLLGGVLAVAGLMGCGMPGEARTYVMSIDRSALLEGQQTEGCPGFTDEEPTRTVETELEGSGNVESWSVFDGWEGKKLLSGAAIVQGFGYGPGLGFADQTPEYIESSDGKTFSGKVTTTFRDEESQDLVVTVARTVTVTFEKFGTELKGSYAYEYARTCSGGSEGTCENEQIKPLVCKTGTATFIGREVASETVDVSGLN